MRPSLWICQCMKVERRSIFCIRYMPTFRPPGLRVLRDHRGEGDERRRVARPAGLDRQQVEVHVVAGEDDLLARAGAHGLRAGAGDLLELHQARDLLAQSLGRLHLEHVLELLPDVVQAVDTEGEAHPPLGAELVDQQRELRALGVVEEERRAARLDRAVDDLRDLEVRIDLGANANELALALEQRDPVAEVAECHRA